MPFSASQSRLSQEGLKTIACVSMLLDHLGVIIVKPMFEAAVLAGNPVGAISDVYTLLRILGRLAFPIYCFLLSEGIIHTRNPGRYGLRLLAAAILSELSYDFALHGVFSWQDQSVMVTLLLGFLALQLMAKTNKLPLKLLVLLPFALAAEYLEADYGAKGVALISLFSLTRDLPRKYLWQLLGMWFLFSPGHRMIFNWISTFSLTTQELAVFALIPISLYSGEKKNSSKLLQWGFYLFYPVHLALLWLVKGAIYG